jgi:hypothetical protein
MNERAKSMADPECNKKNREWRKACISRDHHECQLCGEKEHLHVHHLKKWSLFPKERFNPDNGVTVCQWCHKEITEFNCPATRILRIVVSEDTAQVIDCLPNRMSPRHLLNSAIKKGLGMLPADQQVFMDRMLGGSYRFARENAEIKRKASNDDDNCCNRHD